MMRTALLLTLPLLAACGARRLPDDLLRRLPYQTRIELLEAENELALVRDRVDESANDRTRAREALRRARARLDAAEDEEARAPDTVSREVAQLALEEARARVEHLRAKQRLQGELHAVEEHAWRCALDRFELARLLAARKVKLAGSEALEPREFEAQAAECEAEVKAERAALTGAQAAERTAREAWEARKAALAKRTFDARASPYVEAL